MHTEVISGDEQLESHRPAANEVHQRPTRLSMHILKAVYCSTFYFIRSQRVYFVADKLADQFTASLGGIGHTPTTTCSLD